MLVTLAVSWLHGAAGVQGFLIVGTGVVLALLAHHLGFLRIVDKNLARILPMAGKKCIFAFIPWKSYLVILIMVAMGAILRHSFIPKQYLAVVYVTIGFALVLSSFRYLRVFCREVRKAGAGLPDHGADAGDRQAAP